jgi:hypothetical protein
MAQINMALPGAPVQQSWTCPRTPRVCESATGGCGATVPLVVAAWARCLPARAENASAEVNC